MKTAFCDSNLLSRPADFSAHPPLIFLLILHNSLRGIKKFITDVLMPVLIRRDNETNSSDDAETHSNKGKTWMAKIS